MIMPMQRSAGFRDWIALGIALLICLGTAALGAAWTSQSVDTWYTTLQKPSWNPPNWLFGPVWTTLYISMAVAAWLVWRSADLRQTRMPLLLFGLQLLLNVIWSGLFFALRSPGWAFVDIIVLWLAILATVVAFARVSTWAGVLLLPYLAWVSFATVLNGTIWRLNA